MLGTRTVSLRRAISLLLTLPLVASAAIVSVLAAEHLAPRPALALIAVTIASILAGLAGLTLMRRFLYHVESVSRAMAAMAEGRFGTVPAGPFREMHALAVSFNAMAAQLQASQQTLTHQAFHDPLTGLPNRAHFMARLTETLARGNDTAVLFIDLDRFKVINDTLGHAVGDALLTVVAARLEAAAGGDALVARLGGDEFTALLEGDDCEQRAVRIAQAILRRMQRAISASGHELFVNASVGISIAEARSLSATEILRRADIALYRAKSEGRGRYVAFRASLHELPSDKMDLDSGLRRAVEREQLRLVYQPEIDLHTGAIAGMEALLRWEHPHLGVLSPASFIAMAEETGEIINFGQWALQEACAEAIRLGGRSPAASKLVVSVNLSAAEFKDPTLPQRVAGVLKESGLPPERLKLELTESVLVENVSATVRILGSLKRLGVQLAIDDFGTGYSSLSYIQSFAVDTLKIDQSFVRRLGQDNRTDAIIEAVVDLARALHMEITAEGVETRAQAAYLAEKGCHHAQGNYFSEPLSPEDFERFVAGTLERQAA
jgi:diguanylate cyclase (GGDEF)-like protein